jgi:hypothetical protein
MENPSKFNPSTADDKLKNAASQQRDGEKEPEPGVQDFVEKNIETVTPIGRGGRKIDEKTNKNMSVNFNT